MEHELIDRFTADVDLFTNIDHDIGATAAELAERLIDSDFQVVIARSSPYFARLEIDQLDVDLAHNWRADPPGQSDIGPILSIRDAIAGKIEALFTRIENRDVVDVAQLLEFYSMTQMAAWASDRDEGFSLGITYEMVVNNAHRPDAGFNSEAFEQAHAKVLAAISEAIEQGLSPSTVDLEAEL